MWETNAALAAQSDLTADCRALPRIGTRSFRIPSRAVRHWASPLRRPDGKGIPFKVLLLCDRDEQAVLLRQEIASAVHKMR
ncbi:hypothetical protein ACFPIJ_51045 [Dactylosporangium cerinum]|uniref:Uncharacterized protein n=1 Tax=Dactylosporangium cerinum TaxID=1434730 RepID=A0ABV9WF77_9ACTN